MMGEQYLIDLIKSKTSYTDVTLADESTVDLINTPLTTPRIMVGTIGVKLQYPETFFTDAYRGTENQELQVSSIQLICLRGDLVTVRQAIKDAYTGESPFTNDSNYSTLNFMEGNVVAKTGTKIWWQELIGLVMPRVS